MMWIEKFLWIGQVPTKKRATGNCGPLALRPNFF
nr:MAG TPA: hypothetical protein [Caudoviricetes sp.]